MNKIVVVLGMHRSGTSALTRGLEALGVSLGDNLMPPCEGNNEKGFWEDLEIVALNDALLAELGMSWHGMGMLHATHIWSSLLDGPLGARAERYLLEQSGRFTLFGIKDPRMSRLLPFWKEIFRRCSLEPVFIVCCRDPLSVAQSLARRDGFPKEKSYFLWMEHQLATLSGVAGSRACVSSFDRLLSNPSYEMQRIASAMGLCLQDQQGYEDYAGAFLDTDLRHFQNVADDLRTAPGLLDLALELHEDMEQLAADKMALEDPRWCGQLAQLLQRFIDLGPVYRLMARFDGQLTRSEQLLAERGKAFDSLLEDRDGLSGRLIHALAETAAISESLVRVQSEGAALADALSRKTQDLDAERLRVSHLNGRVEALREQLTAKAEDIQKIYSSVSWRITGPLRLLARLLRGQRPLVTGGLRNLLLSELKRVYWKLPEKLRKPLLHLAFRTMGSLFKGKGYYEQWRNHRVEIASPDFRVQGLCLIDEVVPAKDVQGRIAIHLHLYYEDLAHEFAGLLRNMPYPYDLFVSVKDEVGREECSQVFANLPLQGQLTVEQVPNRGRDLAPMFCTFGARLKEYDFIAHLHGKKSLYNSGATEGWRQYLCSGLLGSRERIGRIFSLMQDEAPKGIVYPQNYHPVPHFANTWLANKPMGAKWCTRLGIPLPRGYFDFPVGTMFWARGEALRPLFDADIMLDDFAPEEGQTDGTLAHCLERLLVLVSRHQGYPSAIIKDQEHPSWSAWRLEQCVSRSSEIAAQTFSDPAVKVVGFDIFDTLVCRPLLDPETIKRLVASHVSDELGDRYLAQRAVAESQARYMAGRDVCLPEIYRQLAQLAEFSDETLSQLMKLEQTLERASVSARPGSVDLFNQALASGKRVALVSDMFLPRAVIEESLRDCGFDSWDELFVSGEIGRRKDSGELYPYLLEHYRIAPDEFLMVGDNERSDVQIPLDMGCRILPVLKPTELARGTPRFTALLEQYETSQSLDVQIGLGLVVRESFSPLSHLSYDPLSLLRPTPFDIGYSVLGPLLTGFAEWLRKSACNDGIDRLYFLAREGQLLKRVYDEWCAADGDAPDSRYLVLSRRAVIVPTLSSLEEILAIARVVYYPGPLEGFLFERYGLQLDSDQWQAVHAELGLDATDIVEVKGGKIDAIVPLLRWLEPEIRLVADRECAAMMQYLKSMGLHEPVSSAVVDVGYSGTIQNYLNILTRLPIAGYYLMTDSKVQRVCDEHAVLARGAYYDRVERDEALPPMYRHSFELEKLLSAHDAQLVNYSLSDDLKPLPAFRELSLRERRCAQARDEIQRGALRYVADAVTAKQTLCPDFSPSLEWACQLYELFISDPSAAELDILNQFALDDFYCGRGVV